MATPNVGILTNAGKNLIDQVNAGQTKITFSKILFSSMNNNQLTDDQIKALTTVAPQEVVVNNPKVTLDNDTGETRIRATGNNEALTDGVYVKTYAVYAKDDSSNEILYGITVSPNPNYLPEYDGVTPQAVTYSYKVNISNTSNITFTNSNDIYVSDTDLAEALQPYAKTIDVNQQLDKKVNVADMRKPASDVAGIEEVNAKQDKIGYTPADDSKVVHSTDMRKPASDVVGLEDVPNGLYKGSLANNTDLDTLTQEGIYSFAGTSFVNFIDSNNHWGTIQIINKSAMIVQYIICTGNISDQIFFRTQSGDPATWLSWTMVPRFGMDNRLELPNGENLKPADDSKVAHLSGANNFDTVPTVNNNPLLLASSLPSDLARTTKDANFTAKLQQNGQDVALANHTIYRNPDTGSVSTANTFTAQQTFSIAPTIKDASKDKGDNQAATMADLKSVENSAWHQLDSSLITTDSAINYYNTDCLYRIDPVNKRIYIQWIIFFYLEHTSGHAYLDFSSVVSRFTSQGPGGMMYESGYNAGSTSSVFNISGSKISFLISSGPSVFASGRIEDCWFGYDTLLI